MIARCRSRRVGRLPEMTPRFYRRIYGRPYHSAWTGLPLCLALGTPAGSHANVWMIPNDWHYLSGRSEPFSLRSAHETGISARAQTGPIRSSPSYAVAIATGGAYWPRCEQPARRHGAIPGCSVRRSSTRAAAEPAPEQSGQPSPASIYDSIIAIAHGGPVQAEIGAPNSRRRRRHSRCATALSEPGRPFQCSFNDFSRLLRTHLTDSPLPTARIPVHGSAVDLLCCPAKTQRSNWYRLPA